MRFKYARHTAQCCQSAASQLQLAVGQHSHHTTAVAVRESAGNDWQRERESERALTSQVYVCVCVRAMWVRALAFECVCVCEWAREVGKQKSIATANRLQEAPYNMARSRAKRTWTTQHSAAAAAAAEALELTLASSSPATPHRIPRRTHFSPTPSVEASHSRKMITG